MPLSRVHLVACAKTKLQHAAPAKALYASAWFRRARAFAEASGTPWYILSAEHGLLDPDAVIAPYEAALMAQPAAARRAWAEQVAEALAHGAAPAKTAVILGGRAYRDPLTAALGRRGVSVEAPLAGLGLGQQLAWFDRQLAGAHWGGVGEAVLPAAFAATGRPRVGSPDHGAQAAERRRELRQRAQAHGAEHLDGLELLELLLSRVSPGRAGDLAARLLQRFGDVPHVLGATAPELAQVAEPAIALELKVLHEALRRVLELPLKRREMLASTEAVRAYLRHRLAGLSRECVRVLFLDRRCGLIADEAMGWGTVDHAPVYPREIIRRALELSASGLCLAHNHPSGAAEPSSADVEITRQVVAAGRALGIAVHDHFLVAGETVASFRGLGLM